MLFKYLAKIFNKDFQCLKNWKELERKTPHIFTDLGRELHYVKTPILFNYLNVLT